MRSRFFWILLLSNFAFIGCRPVAEVLADFLAPQGTSISIASGATATNTASVTLTLAGSDATSMYITNSSNCASGGTWQSFSTTKAWTLSQTNSVATVYAKFKDRAGNESSCVSDTIIHDNIAPTITFSSFSPPTPGNSATPTVNFTLSETADVAIFGDSNCSVLGSQIYQMTSGTQSIVTDPIPDGTYPVYAEAIDLAGNSTCTQMSSGTYVVDTTAPTIQSVTSPVADSSPSNGNFYGVGSVIPIQVTFSESVTVNTAGGTPTLTLETGTSDAVVSYTSGSGTTTLTYNYIVRAGDNANNLTYQASSPFLLAGATIQDSAGNDANLSSFPAPTATNSLGANKNIDVASLWDTTAYLKASDAAATAQYGYSAGISGNTIVVGSPNADGSGSAYAIRRNAGSWAQEGILKHGTPAVGDGFGFSVGVSGDTIVVGAPLRTSGLGSAVVFRRAGSTWATEATLSAPNGEGGASSGTFPFSEGDLFGASVAISGDTIVVGAVQEDSSETTITNSTTSAGNHATYTDFGAAYVFERTGSSWTAAAYLKAPNGAATDWYGSSVAISGDSIVVGAFQEDNNATTITNGTNSTNSGTLADSGAAYVIRKTGSTWDNEAYLKASNAGANDQFGGDVAISGDSIVVASAQEDSSETTITNGTTSAGDHATLTNFGAAYVFRRSGSTWSQESYLKASNSGEGDNFGSGIGISGDTIVAGALFEDSSETTITNGTTSAAAGVTDSGAAYVFYRNGNSWSMESYLKALNAGANDEFGNAVGISGRTLVVAARNEASDTVAIQNNPTLISIAENDNALGAGSAYVFSRTGETIGTPSVSRVFPSSGKPAGDHIHIFGTNFRESSTASVGGATCTSTFIQSSTEIICQLPTSPGSGAHDVLVTNPDSISGSLAAAYTY